MTSNTLSVTEIRTFIPCRDFDTSIAFYRELGFEHHPVNDELALMQNGPCFVFLQRFYQKALAENFMLQVCVEDIRVAHDAAQQVSQTHHTKVTDITHEHWGDVFYLWGPSGELLHMTQLIA